MQKFVSRTLNPNDGHRYLPYIVVIIDEFGDLIMTAGKDIELPIARIAQFGSSRGHTHDHCHTESAYNDHHR